jgi:hypothetical protein
MERPSIAINEIIYCQDAIANGTALQLEIIVTGIFKRLGLNLKAD